MSLMGIGKRFHIGRYKPAEFRPTTTTALQCLTESRILFYKHNYLRTRPFKLGCTVCSTSVLQSWRIRRNGCSTSNLHLLANHKMVKELSQVIVLEVVCKVYTECKETSRNSSRNVPTIATEKLQVIHFDVCGPMQIETPRGNKYFISFIIDLTKKI
ncbi:hypothetical protein CR513_23307, partial [Mucuna pruriens]